MGARVERTCSPTRDRDEIVMPRSASGSGASPGGSYPRSCSWSVCLRRPCSTCGKLSSSRSAAAPNATWSVAAFRSARVPVLAAPKEETDRVLERRRFRHGAELAGDEFGGVAERAQALAHLQDEHASEWLGPVHYGGAEDGRRGLRLHPCKRARSYPRSPYWRDGLDRSAPALKPAIRSPRGTGAESFSLVEVSVLD
jgi:hypothetical protein